MTLIVILVFLMLITLSGVSVAGRLQQRRRQRRLEQRKLRLQAEELMEVVDSLAQTLPNAAIVKQVNDLVIGVQRKMLSLEEQNRDPIETAIRKSEMHSEELINPKVRRPVSYQRDSDALIAKTQLHINTAVRLITQLGARGTINEVEVDTYLNELKWAHLMVSVMSFIAQGGRSMAVNEPFAAQAFYRKAQQLLMESMHQDPRRLKMIKELGEIAEGNRGELSRDLRE